MKRNAAYVLAGIATINMIFIIVSLSAGAWFSVEGRNFFSIWINGENVPSSLKAVRAFMLLGFFVQVGAIIFCLLVALQKAEKKVYGEILFSVSGLFLFIALVVFAAELATGNSLGYGYSYVLGWIACIGSLILAAAYEFLSRKT